MLFQKEFMVILLSFFLTACGAGDGSNKTEDKIESEENLTNENNFTIESNLSTPITDINYTDEELTLSAYERYITNSSSEFSAKIVSLLFKGALPVKDGFAIIKEGKEFSFKLTWQNSEYAKNVNFYFFNGNQRGIQYITAPLDEGAYFYESSCQALSDYRFKCNSTTLDESKIYEGRSSPVHSSFVMAVCDRDTKDPKRVCDFIRIPIELQKSNI